MYISMSISMYICARAHTSCYPCHLGNPSQKSLDTPLKTTERKVDKMTNIPREYLCFNTVGFLGVDVIFLDPQFVH